LVESERRKKETPEGLEKEQEEFIEREEPGSDFVCAAMARSEKANAGKQASNNNAER